MKFVDQIQREELGMHVPAPFHEQPPHPAPPELVEQTPPVEHGPGADDIGERPQGAAGPAHRTVEGEDELCASAVPEGEIGTEIGGPGDGDLERMLGLPGSDASSAKGGTRNQQPGVVLTQGVGSDENGVSGSTFTIDPIQVSPIGQYEPISGGVIETTVDGDGRRQHDVRAGHHGQRERW